MYHPAKSTWVNPNIEYLFNDEIIEYDIKDAGISIVKQYKLLGQDDLKNLMSLDKKSCHVLLGNLQRERPGLSKALSSRFAELRELFLYTNNLSTEKNVISIKKDAIYTIGPCKKLKFDTIEFTPKNIYSSYIRFVNNMNIEIYYSQNGLDIKGIGDSGKNKHRLYLIDFLRKTIGYLETKNFYIKKFLRTFIDEYKKMKLDDGYYLEFNNRSVIVDAMYNYQKVVIPLVQIVLKEMD